MYGLRLFDIAYKSYDGRIWLDSMEILPKNDMKSLFLKSTNGLLQTIEKMSISNAISMTFYCLGFIMADKRIQSMFMTEYGSANTVSGIKMSPFTSVYK